MKSRIHCQRWNHFYGRMDQLGVIWADPAVARKVFERFKLTIQEQILSADGNRVWTLGKRQWSGRKPAKVSSPGQPGNTAAI